MSVSSGEHWETWHVRTKTLWHQDSSAPALVLNCLCWTCGWTGLRQFSTGCVLVVSWQLKLVRVRSYQMQFCCVTVLRSTHVMLFNAAYCGMLSGSNTVCHTTTQCIQREQTLRRANAYAQYSYQGPIKWVCSLVREWIGVHRRHLMYPLEAWTSDVHSNSVTWLHRAAAPAASTRTTTQRNLTAICAGRHLVSSRPRVSNCQPGQLIQQEWRSCFQVFWQWDFTRKAMHSL